MTEASGPSDPRRRVRRQRPEALAALGMVPRRSRAECADRTLDGPIALFGLVGWAALWLPYVVIRRRYHWQRTANDRVPWPADRGGRRALRAATVRRRTAGSRPGRARGPSGRQPGGGASGGPPWSPSSARTLVELGYLDDPRLERPCRVTWHVPVIAAGLDAFCSRCSGPCSPEPDAHDRLTSRTLRARAFSIARADGICFWRGSNASRRPSPMKLTESAIMMMNSPGHQNNHGRVENADW